MDSADREPPSQAEVDGIILRLDDDDLKSLYSEAMAVTRALGTVERSLDRRAGAIRASMWGRATLLLALEERAQAYEAAHEALAPILESARVELMARGYGAYSTYPALVNVEGIFASHSDPRVVVRTYFGSEEH